MKEAEIEATETKTSKLHCKTVPKYLNELIQDRKHIIKAIKKDKFNQNLKSSYNFLTKLIKNEFKALHENLWTNFCNPIENTKKNSSEYWKKIKLIGNLEDKNTQNTKSSLPPLKIDAIFLCSF